MGTDHPQGFYAYNGAACPINIITTGTKATINTGQNPLSTETCGQFSKKVGEHG